MQQSLIVLAATLVSTLAVLPAAACAQAGAAVVAPAAPPGASAARPPLAGRWTGTLRAGPIAATLQLDFAAGADGRMGVARITPDGPQPALGGDIRDVVVGDGGVTFSVLTPEGTMRFTGAPDAQGTLRGQLVVVGDGGTVEARGVWTAAARPCGAGC